MAREPSSLSQNFLSLTRPPSALSLSRGGVGGRQQGAAASGPPVRGWPRGSRPRWAQRQAVAGRGGRARPSAAAGRGRRRAGPGAREAVRGGRAPAHGRPCAAAGRGRRAALAAAGSGPRCATLQASRSRPAAGAERWSTARQEQPPKVKKKLFDCFVSSLNTCLGLEASREEYRFS